MGKSNSEKKTPLARASKWMTTTVKVTKHKLINIANSVQAPSKKRGLKAAEKKEEMKKLPKYQDDKVTPHKKAPKM